ncbi:hypothetical protein [Natronobacterium texcoconense]|uniref:Uncharacterized protein n=1 Tax=Natronobacterium texcoconense TaxID=1095778 RepID=A0A1H1G2C3_NATTX|nr:hypothetical protein [Natronobacterium texcoconense]SDR07341.1 hypothetical protein SAMN04489842_2226 [Natronobacterium texcoconense]
MSLPSHRRFILGCFVVLLAALLAFTVVGVAGTPSLSATEFDPDTDHEELASAPSIHNAEIGSPPGSEVRDAFEVAATDGRYEGTIENASSGYSFIRDDRYDFVLFDGSFYEFEADVDGESVVIETDERTARSVADELAVSFENAAEPTQEAIETGDPVEYPGGDGRTPIVVDNDTYYAVTLGPPKHGSGTTLGWVLLPFGVALAAGVGVLAVGGLWLRRRRHAT